MNKVLALIKQRYLEDNHILDATEALNTTFTHTATNAKGNAVFLVSKANGDNVYYEHQRVDLSCLDMVKTLSIPRQYRNDYDVNHNKAMIANWVTRYSGHHVLDEDIAYLVPDKETLTVVLVSDSMRFTPTSFRLIRL